MCCAEVRYLCTRVPCAYAYVVFEHVRQCINQRHGSADELRYLDGEDSFRFDDCLCLYCLCDAYRHLIGNGTYLNACSR